MCGTYLLDVHETRVCARKARCVEAKLVAPYNVEFQVIAAQIE